MIRPTYLPEWAVDDVNLPATGNVNKVRPRTVLRSIGWDQGQIPTAEEFNWLLNNIYQWVSYADENIELLDDTYLPRNGTQITLTGGVTGTATFTGSTSLSIPITVTNNSHTHVSANITDATLDPVPNTIVKRGSLGSAAFTGVTISNPSTSTQRGIYFSGESGFIPAAAVEYTPPDFDGVERITLYSGSSYILVSDINGCSLVRPRSMSPQENLPDALVRLDYVNFSVNTAVDTATNNLVALINAKHAEALAYTDTAILNLTNYVNNTFVRAVRLAGRVRFTAGGAVPGLPQVFEAPAGCVLVSLGQSGSEIVIGDYSALQVNINGVWATVASV